MHAAWSIRAGDVINVLEAAIARSEWIPLFRQQPLKTQINENPGHLCVGNEPGIPVGDFAGVRYFSFFLEISEMAS
jgi:hypothetical protein